MSLSDQRSTQRLIDELMEELTPRSPTGSFGSPTPPLPRSTYVDRVGRASGHRRTNSSPGSVTSATSTSGPDVRGRTLSGGTFGRALGSDGLMSDVETIRSGRAGFGGAASAPISPTLNVTPLPSVQLPLIAARTNRASKAIATPSKPAVLPSILLPSPPPLSPPAIGAGSPARPTHIQSPPLITPPQAEDARQVTTVSHVSLPPASSPAPRTPSGKQSIKSRDVMPASHPFATVVAMMEEGDSPSRRRSRISMHSQELLKSPTPTKTEKGKARDNGERPSEGRKQTPRRGFVGPGGLIPRLASRASLAKLRGSQITQPAPTCPSGPQPLIVPIPPSPPSIATLPEGLYIHAPHRAPGTPATPDSTSYLRPAPATPLTPFWAKPRSAVSSSRQVSPSPSRQPTPTHAPRSGGTTTPGLGIDGLPQHGRGEDLIEIPRFKKKELNLGIVRRKGPSQKIAWLALWTIWLSNGLLSLFFDVNVVYILIQCTIHPSFDTNSAKTWQFATAAYVVLWVISTLAVWLGWEIGYEFWRRWRLPRPAIEPMYLSLPASLHLSLTSFDHFTFLLHIRTSPIGTPHSRDIIPETCHALLQLLPGLLPLLPRAAIAVVVLISFWDPAAEVQAPYGGSIDEKSNRDSNFFRAESPGQLTNYAKGILLTFTVWTAIRLLVVIGSGGVLWSFSQRPLGGLLGNSFPRKRKDALREPPTTPKRKPKSSIQPRDPSTTNSPQKSWIEQENEFEWAWRERARARIQDAFELCMIRRNNRGMGSFLYQSEIPWGRMMEQRSTRRVSMATTPIEMSTPGPSRYIKPPESHENSIDPSNRGPTAVDIRNGPAAPPSDSTSKSAEKSRPESTLDPTGTATSLVPDAGATYGRHLNASTSRANTAASNSATDLFYTPAEGNSPQTERTISVAEGNHQLPVASGHDNKQNQPPPPSAFTTGGNMNEFGMIDRKTGRSSPDSTSGSGEGEDESTGLLSASSTATPSPRNSLLSSRNRSASNGSHYGSSNHSHIHDHSRSGSGTGSDSRSSSRSRPRAYTTSSPHRSGSLSRARSSSIGLLRESVANAAAAGGNFVRRARSGTVLSSETGYSKMSRDQDHEDDAEILDGNSVPRSRRGTGPGLGHQFGMAPLTPVPKREAA